MAFQVPVPNAAHSEFSRVGAADVVRIKAAELNQPVLQVGRLLEVTIADRSGLGMGLMIQGQFVPALLPRGAQAGDRLKVRVEENTDALILKILGQTGEVTKQQAVDEAVRARSGTVANLFNLLLPDDKQADIRKAAETLRQQVAPDGLSVSTKRNLPALVEQLVDRLRSERSALSEATLKDSKEVASTLAHLAEHSLHASIKEARRSVDVLTRASAGAPLERFAEALVKHLQAVLADPAPVGFDLTETTPAASGVRSQLALSIALSSYALATKQPQALEQVQQQLSQPASKAHPLLLLLKVAFDSEALAFPSSKELTPLAASIEAFIKELGTLRQQSAPDKVVRASVKKHAELLATSLPQRSGGAGIETPSSEALAVASTLERVLVGQEALNTVNSVLRSFGEPSLVMIPLILQGLCVPMELVMYPPGVAPDGKRRAPKQNEEHYTRLEFRAQLPALGAVGVEIAFRKEEALVSIVLQSQELADLVASKAELLSARLREKGFQDAEVTARQGLVESMLVPCLIPEKAPVTVA